jgi:Tol biopolymer transport system component
MKKRILKRSWLMLGLLTLTSFIQFIAAQDFGQNKPVYKVFNYKVYQTPHFEIYHYLKNDSVLNKLAQLSEQWHSLHESIFKQSLTKNPIIFYSDHADFQQTTAISGDIDVGTGGVTEALKNRVVLPIAASYAQTCHVLGHELVHAFQYHLLLSGDSGSLNNLRYLPVWMVEGMAEYLSLGSVDPNTAMWMRDAIANNDFPTLQDLTRSNKYFPYRYGECFWAFVGRTWGDTVIIPLFKETAKYGYEIALKNILGYDEKTISDMWKSAMVNQYQKYLDIALTVPVGSKILFSKNAGDMNISPELSPDGKYVIFLSEKDVFTFDLYLADAHTGKIIRKISSTVNNSEIDAFNYVESAGTWSPDGKKFAFVIFAKGENKLMIVDVQKGRIIHEYAIPGLPTFNNPAWSPIDNKIALSGMVEGQNSLYIYDLDTKKLDQVTHDNYSYLQPSWSRDGKYLTYSTDKPINGGMPDPHGAVNLGTINLSTKEMKLYNVFNGAKNLNPLFSNDNKSIYFLSDRDGFRNLYRYSLDSAKVYQMSKFFTGISGITDYSPSVSLARNQDLLSYSYFYGGKYSIYSTPASSFKPFEVKPDSLNFDAGTLPPIHRLGVDLVDNNLNKRMSLPLISRDSFTTVPYRPNFRLDYVTQTGISAGTSRFGTGMAGSIFAMFSDIVGQNQMFTTLAVNGQIYDIGGLFAYLNSKHKINWGASVSHIPYLYTTYSYKDTAPGYQEYYNYYRLFEDKISLFGIRPLNKTHRIELGASTAWYYYRLDQDVYTTDSSGNTTYQRVKGKAPAGFRLQGVNAAYVVDNSFFGMTAPMRGFRYRIGIENNFGQFHYTALDLDFRRYLYQKPLTFAFRLDHYGRYGLNSNLFSPIYLGYPWYVRGFDASKVQNYQNDTIFSVNNLLGNRIAVASFEIRLPLSGPRKIALIKSNYFFADIAPFFDAGLAWDNNNQISLRWKPNNKNQRTPIFSTGLSMRINVLGALIIEPYYAFPLQFGGIKNPVFGLNFLPGW